MNAKLAESLAEAIAALSPEDYALFQESLVTKTVRKTPGVAGGYACIRNTRIPVWTLISLSQQGMDDEALLRNFPGLTPFDVLASRIYYRTHPAEIEALITSHHSEEAWDDV